MIAQVDDELFWSRKWGIYLGCWSGLEVVEGSFVDKYLVSQMTKEERDKMRPLRKRDELGWGCGSTQFDADILLMVAMLLAIGIVLGMLGNFLKV